MLQSLCAILLICAILLDIPWYLKYYIFPIVSLSFIFFLVTLRINETREKILDQYNQLLEKHIDDNEWLNKELYELTKKRNYIVFNNIHKAKYEILKIFLEKDSSDASITHLSHTTSQPQQQSTVSNTSLKKSLDQYNEELYNKVWTLLDEYITKTLTPLFTKDDISLIKFGVFEFFINDKRKLDTENKVIIPTCLSMQDIAHFLHNISELMSYYKKIRQVDFFKYIPYFMALGDNDPQSLYRNSTRASGSSLIPLCRISEDNNIISDFVKKIKGEMPNNQRIIS